MGETLKELNQQAIEDGLFLPDGQLVKKDYSALLGKELSGEENHCYRIIAEHTPNGPVAIETIYKGLFFVKEEDYLVTENDRQVVWLKICRIRKKLGREELILKYGLGYQSRRVLNCLKVSPEGIEPSFRV